jgi:uncharacterized protein with beta-barrel porin domain
MNRFLLSLSFAAAIAAWSPASWAQRQSAAGPGVIPLSPTGVANGVDMSASGTTGTLSVGVLGGPEMDIFTTNTSLASPFLAVSTAASSQGNITFNSSSTVYGTIGITPPGGPFLLDVNGGANGSVVNFQGPVYATTLNVTGTGSMNFNSGSTNQFPNGLIFGGDGTISLAPNTTVVGAITTTAGTNTGTLSLGGGSILNGAVGAGSASLKAINVVGGSNSTGVSATITGAVNAYSFSLGTNTLHIGGALTIADSTSSGVINTTLANPTLYGNIRPVGFTTIGPTLHVIVTVPAGALIPVGTQFNIIQAQTGTAQSGSQSRIVVATDPSNPLYTFSQVPLTGTQAGLVAIQTTGIPITVVIPPVTPPATPPATPPVVTPPVVIPPVVAPIVPVAVPVVPVLLATPVLPVVAPVVAAINALTTPAAVVSAVAQLAPSVPDLAAPQVTFQGTREFENFWLSHLDDVMCGQVSQPHQPNQPDTGNATCRRNEPQAGGWLKGFGYFGSQGSQAAYGGYSFNIYGTMVGYDAPILHSPFGGETRVGFGIGYARNTIDGSTFSAYTAFDTYAATVYIAHEQGPWFVDGDLSFGWNDYSETRNISFPSVTQTAQGSYSGQDYTAFATTGYHFFAQRIVITPLASLQYTHMDIGSYAESGAGGIDLNVNSQHYDFLESGLGVKVADPFRYHDGTFVPEAHFKWFHELVNPTARNTAAFAVAGSPLFTTPGLRPAADMFDVGAGLTFLDCACTAKTWSLEGTYDYFWRSDLYGANQVMLRFTMRF